MCNLCLIPRLFFRVFGNSVKDDLLYLHRLFALHTPRFGEIINRCWLVQMTAFNKNLARLLKYE